MGSAAGFSPGTNIASGTAPARYCWNIFSAPQVRKGELSGTPYRYWSSYAIAYEYSRRLKGKIDFLDAGGRDGGTLRLLADLSLQGTYTLMDLEPKMNPAPRSGFEIEVFQSSFADFQPRRQFDVMQFQSCLEYVKSYKEVAWAANALKPGGFLLATVACRNTRWLYWGVWNQGGHCLLDEEDLAPAFAEAGLKIVHVFPLGGAVSRTYQSVLHTYLGDFVKRVYNKTVGLVIPTQRRADPMRPIYRLLNEMTVRLDRLAPFWRTGHCIIAQRMD